LPVNTPPPEAAPPLGPVAPALLPPDPPIDAPPAVPPAPEIESTPELPAPEPDAPLVDLDPPSTPAR
jgi:hypothetical protein